MIFYQLLGLDTPSRKCVFVCDRMTSRRFSPAYLWWVYSAWLWQALETIKKLRKDKAQEVKEFKLKLEHLNTNKNSAHKLRTEVEQSTRRKVELEQQIHTLEEQIQKHTEVARIRINCSVTLMKEMQEYRYIGIIEVLVLYLLTIIEGPLPWHLQLSHRRQKRIHLLSILIHPYTWK